MLIITPSFVDFSDEALSDIVTRFAADERSATAHLIASLAEFDSRRLYLGAGCSSLFTYCTQILHLSEHAAYNRIEAARPARRFPRILDLLADGAITLTTVTLLAPHLTPDNHENVLEAARHRSKREVERQVAALHPRPDVPPSVRRQPAPKSAVSTAIALVLDDTPREAPGPIAHAPLVDSAGTGPDGPRETRLTPAAVAPTTNMPIGARRTAESERSCGGPSPRSRCSGRHVDRPSSRCRPNATRCSSPWAKRRW